MSSHACPWPLAPHAPRLDPHEVHLWCTPLDLPRSAIEGLLPALAEDERRRADRFRLGELRDRFIAGRGLLRWVLSRYLRIAPAELRFDYEPRGKPVLRGQGTIAAGEYPRTGDLSFNVSHSHSLAMFAVAAGHPIGVDLEQVRPMRDLEGLVERFFAPAERRQWGQLPETDRPLAFFYGWTRKEAWLKATGSGLSFPLSEFCVNLDPAEPARLISIRGDTGEAAAWRLDSCQPCPDYVASLAVRAAELRIVRWRLEEEGIRD
ncbi:MAG: 4'-phosphopantetheinyl transferase superfamily protein [Thermoguttaceae bacterium]